MTEQEKLQQLLEAAQSVMAYFQKSLEAISKPTPKTKKVRPVKPTRKEEEKGLKSKTLDLLKFLWNKYQNQWVYVASPEFEEALKACNLATTSSNKYILINRLEERKFIEVTRNNNVLLRFCLTKNPN